MSQKDQLEYMKVGKISVITVILLGLMLIIVMPVFGSTGHVHKGISPFEKNGQNKNIHCLLNGHNHQNKICPHALLLGQINKEGFFIGAECGGNPHGSLPVKNIFNKIPYIYTQYISPPLINSEEVLHSNSSLHLFYLPNSLDRPPKNV
jgi:hypothetical protein